MTELRRSRQADLVNPDIFENPITVIGCGAIGSFTTLTLAKMGFHDITVYDNDSVGEENISNQFYRYKDIGMNKAEALYGMVHDFEDIQIKYYRHNWETEALSGHVIMAVDSMVVRKHIFDAVKRNVDVDSFIDGRMGGQQAEVYTVDLRSSEDKRIYLQYLWSETEASELPCTQKAVMYNVLWIASMIANNTRLLMEGKRIHNVMRMDFQNANHMNVVHG